MGILARFTSAIVGSPYALSRELLARYPELGIVRVRRGGLPPRVAGWALLLPSAAAITLWRTVFVAPAVALEARLLLHELRHVQQFQASPLFPLRYLWASLRHGYHANPYEIDARSWAEARLRDGPPSI